MNNKIDIEPIVSFRELIQHDAISKRKIMVAEKSESSKKQVYSPWNQLCTCVLRIEETACYINSLPMNRANSFGEAFNFYEFLNCCSIVFECAITIFHIFGSDAATAYGKNELFKKSNHSKTSDFKFFKFVRSACAVHPECTTRYSNITKLKHEFYPYCVWNDGLFGFLNDAPTDFDIALCSWNSNPSCHHKYYYLYLGEFYSFINKIISCISSLSPIIEEMISGDKNTRNFKRLKKEKDFEDRSAFCIYLRDKLKRRSLDKHEFADGGLLIATHVLSNRILSDEFKKAVFENVEEIAERMKNDIDSIGFDDAYSKFKGLYEISDFVVCKSDLSYISEKLEYLEDEAKREIKDNDFSVYRTSLRFENDNMNYSNCEWTAFKLLNDVAGLYENDDLLKTESFADLYELTLQAIWRKQKLLTVVNDGGEL